jgi:hypothetical protein
VLAASLFFVASSATAIGFVAVRGGLSLSTGSQAALASGVPSGTPGPTMIAPSGAPSQTPTTPPSGAPSLEPTPPAAPTSGPTTDRYAVLETCPDTPACYIYTVRRGNGVWSIANYFGVPFQAVIDMNPWIGASMTLHVGDRVRIPPPTR